MSYPIGRLITSVSCGRYQPSRGSAGAVLLEAHPSTDPHVRGRSLARFARVALRRQGLWWVMVLEADPDQLADDETAYITTVWREWCAGVNPFRGRRACVAA